MEGAVTALQCRTSDRSTGTAEGARALAEAIAERLGVDPRYVGAPGEPAETHWQDDLRDFCTSTSPEVAAEFLGALGIVPDLGIFERPVDVLEAGFLYIDVKDTSAARPGVRAGQRRYLRSG